MRTAILSIALLTLLHSVCARPQFPNRIPNGDASTRAGSGITCRHLGHINCQAPTGVDPMNNQFGIDFRTAGFQWTPEFCRKDSDGDGLTNGEELGDPCCEWTTDNNKLARTTNLSHPGDSNQKAEGSVSCSTPPVAPAANQSATVTPTPPSMSPGQSPSSPAPSPSSGAPAQSPGAPAQSPGSSASMAASPTPSQMSPPPSISPTASPPATDSAVCFPGDATVRLHHGAIVRMADLAIGDVVEVAHGVYSPVFMFTHKLRDIRSEFVNIRTTRGASLHLSPGHFVYFNGRLAAASEVRVGDSVEVDGTADTVAAVDRVFKTGLYNPQTVRGDIVVDRVKVSTFTQTIHFGAAQAALTPFRAVFAWFGLSVRALESGVPDALLPPRAQL